MKEHTEMNGAPVKSILNLKECYEIASRIEHMPAAKEVIVKRLNTLDDDHSGAGGDFAAEKITVQSQYSRALFELSRSAEDPSAEERARIIAGGMEASAEKEYLLALLSLTNGTSERQRIDAMRHITSALAAAPNDPRSIALAGILQEAGR